MRLAPHTTRSAGTPPAASQNGDVAGGPCSVKGPADRRSKQGSAGRDERRADDDPSEVESGLRDIVAQRAVQQTVVANEVEGERHGRAHHCAPGAERRHGARSSRG